MKTYLGGARRLHLTALVMGSLLYGSAANAANLVSTIPSDYGNSEMGTVTGSRVTTHVDAAPQPGVLKNLNRDPASFVYHQQGKSKVFLRQYTYSVTDLEGNLIIDPNSAGAAATIASGKIKAVPNTHAAAGSDSHIYVTGYDLGQIGVAHQNGNKLIEDTKATVNLKADIKKYCGYNFNETFQNLDDGRTYTGDPERALVHGEALFIEGRKLYVAVSVNPLAGYEPYDDGFLMQYDIQDDGSLKFGSYTRISRNIDQGRLNKFNDQILVSCIGGYQHYDGTGNRHHTAINIAKLDENGKLKETTQRRVVLPEHVKDTGQDMRDLKILPNGTAYVMTYNLSPSGSQIDAHVYQTTVSNLLSNAPEDWNEILTVENEEGWFGKLNAEYYTKRLWLELGDTLRAYTDGDATEKYKWIAKDFSDNKAFSRFNKITMLEPDWVSGTTASVILAAPAAENSAAVWQGGTAETNPVTASQTYAGDTVIRLGKDLIGNKATNVLAGIYAASGDVHINAAGHTLWLQTENTVGNPTGIYAGKGKNIIVDADAVNIITRGLVGGNTLTNAIQLDAAKNKAAKITINAPVNISMTGGLGGNGVAIQKSDRLGEKSYEASQTTQILLNGALKIAGARTDAWGIPINRENVFSRFNNAGILTQVEKSNITVRGPVDMTVYGNGVTTNANGSSVHLGGGSIQVPSGMKYSYYALAAYQGAIHMNTGADGMTPGTERVVLNGDLFALPTGTLSVALTTANARLHGLVDNGGTANLYLQNGAQWVNEARNMRYYQDSEDIGAGTLTGAGASASYTGKSRITNFHGGMTADKRGVIFQKDAQPLTIDNYSGHTRVLYAHDAATPTTMKGGDLVITRAAAGSAITLTTDSAGLNTTSTKATDKNRVSAALDALAKKLYYTAYKTNERNLIGKTEIAEGLTASSATRRIENITFNNATGQGGYAYTPATDPKPPQPKPDKPKPPQPKPDKPKPPQPKPDKPKPPTPHPNRPNPPPPQLDNPTPPAPQPDKPNPPAPQPDKPKPPAPQPDKPKPPTPQPDKPKPPTPQPDKPKPPQPQPDKPKPPQPQPDKPNPPQPQPDKPKPPTPQPDKPKPPTPQPDKPKPPTPQPDKPKPPQPQPDKPKPPTPQPDKPKPPQPQPDKPKPPTPQPDKPKPPQPQPDKPKPPTPQPDKPKPPTPQPDKPKPPTPQPKPEQRTSFTKGITGTAADTDYTQSGVKKGSAYVFEKTSTITAPTGINATANTPISITAGKGATLTIHAAKTGIAAAAGSRVTIDGERIVINTGSDSGHHSIQAAAGAVINISAGFDLKGGIENSGGTVTLSDTGKTSRISGDVTQSGGTMHLKLTGRNSALQSNITAGGTWSLALTGDGASFTGSVKEAPHTSTPAAVRTMTLGRTALWNVTGGSHLTRMEAQGSTIVQNSNEAVEIRDFKGQAKVLYRGTATPDGTLKLAHDGKFTVQNVLGRGNRLTFATDAFSGSDAADAKLAKTLAQRFEYRGAASNIVNKGVQGLSLNVLIADGIIASQKRYDMRMNRSGKADDVVDIAKTEYGDYETKLMRGVKSAMTAAAMTWRAEANDLMKRMGDLRLSPEDLGAWARVYRGRSTGDKDNTDFRMNYTTIQIGYDWRAGKDWRIGLAGSYMKGSPNFANGSGEAKEGNLGIYGTWTGKSGQYVDIIAKTGRLENNYTVYNDFGHYVKGDYHTWGSSISAEYGKRITARSGSYIEPQVEFIYSHLNGANYTGSTDYMLGGVYQNMYIRQGAYNSFIGRIGLGFGQETQRATYFAKVSLYHEFAGDLRTDYSDGVNPWKHTRQDGNDTWVGVQLGGTVKLSDKTNLYGSFEKTFGGDIKTAWRMDAGLRWSF